jgi:hypothetical protein
MHCLMALLAVQSLAGSTICLLVSKKAKSELVSTCPEFGPAPNFCATRGCAAIVLRGI